MTHTARQHVAPVAPPAVVPSSAAGFSLDQASVTIGDRTVLHPVSLDIPVGRVTALVGHNGSGKSTLLKVLARQIAVTSGSVHYGGQSLTAWGDRPFARKVAYLPQEAPAAAGMLVRELVALGRYPWHGALGRIGRHDRDRIDEALALTGTDTLADRRVETLSGGERQRVWLAMLVAQEAECMLLDEPISALDIGHQLEVMGLIARLSRDKGLGVLVVLHDINTAARFCDDIIALRQGRLIVRDGPAGIMTPDRLRAIYGVAMTVMRHPASGRPVAIAE